MSWFFRVSKSWRRFKSSNLKAHFLNFMCPFQIRREECDKVVHVVLWFEFFGNLSLLFNLSSSQFSCIILSYRLFSHKLREILLCKVAWLLCSQFFHKCLAYFTWNTVLWMHTGCCWSTLRSFSQIDIAVSSFHKLIDKIKYLLILSRLIEQL